MPDLGSHLTGPVRNKARKENNGLREWFSNLPIANEPDFVTQMYDFPKVGSYSTGDYTLTAVGTGSAAVSTSLQNGVLVLTTGAANGPDSENLQNKIFQYQLDNSVGAGDPFLAGKRVWFESNVNMSNVTTCDMFVGLSDSNTTLNSLVNAVGFTISSGAAAISLVSYASSTGTTVASGVNMVAATNIKLGFLYDGGNAVKFFINRSWVATVTTNIPVLTAMSESAYVASHSANARTLNIDYFFICKER